MSFDRNVRLTRVVLKKGKNSDSKMGIISFVADVRICLIIRVLAFRSILLFLALVEPIKTLNEVWVSGKESD